MMNFMKKPFVAVAPLALTLAMALTGCGTSAMLSSATLPSNEVEVEAPEWETPAGESFEEGVLTTADVTIEITDYRVIPIGEDGNERGDVPVLAIWYETTNLGTSDRDISPMTEFIVNFEALQDNDPNVENSLSIGSLPDDSFLDSQLENIKAGGTLANAIAYELTDTTTPVELVAGRNEDELGRMTFNLT